MLATLQPPVESIPSMVTLGTILSVPWLEGFEVFSLTARGMLIIPLLKHNLASVGEVLQVPMLFM